ncbi:MAG: iron complex transport system ATP-binding protein [Ilumatobacteraceae bacterium]
MSHVPPEVLRLVDVSFVRDDRTILAPLTWDVLQGQRWVILGANGSGKTTLLKITAMYEHPSSGDVCVLGERLGRTDVRVLRRRIGYLSPSLAMQLRGELRCLDVVMTAKYAALEPWWHRYEEADEARALACLDRMGVAWLAERALATTSSGEQQRVLLARTLMNDPAVLLLDEPSARLDLAGREQLVQALAELTLDPAAPPLILVTHHLDEVPPGMTHVLMLRDGRVTVSGPIGETLTSTNLSDCFGVPLTLERRDDGRFSAWSPRVGATALDPT